MPTVHISRIRTMVKETFIKFHLFIYISSLLKFSGIKIYLMYTESAQVDTVSLRFANRLLSSGTVTEQHQIF